MNKNRRDRLQRAMEIISEVKEEEEGAYDNMPEPFQDSERGEKMQENIDNMDEVISLLEEITTT